MDTRPDFLRFSLSNGRSVGPGAKYLRWGFFPRELWPLLVENGAEGGMAVQADQTEKETDLLIVLAKEHKWIKGVIGWVDLQADDLIERLDWYRSFSVLKGFRHLLHDEPRRNLMNQPAFLNGIAALSRYDYTYDILIYPDQLKYAARLAGLFPQQKLVLDLLVDSRHCGLDIVRWREDIWDLARRQHVYCKISGMIPIAGSDASARVDFHRYIDEMVKAFGMDRVMFGCDWPLRQAAAAYEAGTRLVQSYFSTFSRMEQELFYIWNAVNFYNL